MGNSWTAKLLSTKQICLLQIDFSILYELDSNWRTLYQHRKLDTISYWRDQHLKSGVHVPSKYCFIFVIWFWIQIEERSHIDWISFHQRTSHILRGLASNHDDENMQQLMHVVNACSYLTKPRKLYNLFSKSLGAWIFYGDLILSIVIKKRASDSYMYNVIYHGVWNSNDIYMRRFNKK